VLRSNPEYFKKLSDFLSTNMTVLLKNITIQNLVDERKTFKDYFPLSQESQNFAQNPLLESEASSRL